MNDSEYYRMCADNYLSRAAISFFDEDSIAEATLFAAMAQVNATLALSAPDADDDTGELVETTLLSDIAHWPADPRNDDRPF